MARTNIPITKSFQSNLQLAQTSADQSNGMQYFNDGTIVLFVKTGGTASTVTIEAVASESGRDVDVEQMIGMNEEYWFGPFRPEWFNQAEGAEMDEPPGVVYVNFSADTDVKVDAVKVLF